MSTRVIPEDLICVNRERMGGLPCMAGTRIPVAQILADICREEAIREYANDMDLPPYQVRELVFSIIEVWNTHFLVDEDKGMDITIKPR